MELILRLLATVIMLIALFLLYRIAYPKQASPKKDNETTRGKPESVPDVMGKSRFVLPDRSKPQQTPATLQETEKREEKPDIFAAETKKERPVAIPAEQVNEVFDDNSNSEIMSIPLDDENEDESEIDFEAEEAEELHRALGHEPVTAEGIDYDKLRTVVKVVNEQPEEVSEETGRTLVALENTDMFEKLV